MKKILSLLMAVLLLTALPLTATAADAVDGVFGAEVLHSITEEVATGVGLAFRFTVNMTGGAKDAAHAFVNTDASMTLDGEQVTPLRMGAVVTNWAATGEDPAALVLENVNGKKVVDVPAAKLQTAAADHVAFAVRVIHLPENHRATAIYARPYCVVLDGAGEERVLYGAIDSTSYDAEWAKANRVILPAIGTDIDVKKQRDRIRVSAASISGTTVSLTFTNYTTRWITEETNWVEYTCYDAEGKELASDLIYIGCIDTKKNKSKTFAFEVPAATAEVRLTDSDIVFWTEWA